ncbi:MAG TPA: AAA family ATPase [Acidimicrobiales bacterium]|nr:AAA family ATPase [Acidimicrobiales bacterium]
MGRRCPACDVEVAAEARYCEQCGSSVGRSCASCGADLGVRARFCSSCGASVGIDGGDDAGELRTVTVLFADMSGSVAAFHGQDAEATTEQVNSVLEAMAGAVMEHGGSVDRFLGDGLLALFGAPEAHEDDPVRAVAAALELCRRVADTGAAATCGLNTGPVYVGRVGSESHSESTVIGPVVNLAARLQGQADRGEVLVAAETARHCRGVFDLAERTLQVKGISEPVTAYAVAPLMGEPLARRPRGDHGAPTIGRDDELAVLDRVMGDLGGGRGAVVLVTGEAGLGKSRLVAEALRRASEETMVLEGRCAELGASPFRPFADAIRGHLGWDPSTPTDVRVADVARLARTADPDDVVVTSALRSLLGLDVDDDPAWTALPPAQRQREVFRAVRLLVAALANETPVVLVVEDVHWADPASVALTAELFSTANDVPLVVLCAYRPARDLPAWTLSAEAHERCPGRVTRVALRELASQSCEAIAHAMLGGADLDADARAFVVERAQGNPLFVEELVRSAVEAGWLVRDGDTWRVDERAVGARVPDTLELLVRSRTDRLPPTVRRVLQLASVQGRIFSVSALAAIEGSDVVDDALAVLEERDLAHPAPERPRDEWAFKHVLVQETIEQGILRRARPDLHLRILDALEGLHAGRTQEHAALLAHHAEAAGDARRALRHLRSAALRAKETHLNDEAGAFLLRALSWSSQPEAGATDATVAELHEHRGDVLHRGGHHDDAVAAYEQSLALTSDALARARLARKVAGVVVIQRRYDDALGWFRRAQAELGDDTPAPGPAMGEWIDLLLARGTFHYWRNEPDEIRAALDRVGQAVDAHGTDAQRADAGMLWMMRTIRETRYVVDDATLDVAFRTATIADRVTDPAFRAFKRFNLAFCRLWARQLDLAVEDFAAAIDDADRAGDVVVLSRCHTYQAVAHRFRLDDERCMRACDAAWAVAEQGGMVEYLAAVEGNRAWLALCRGDDDVAAHHATSAIERWHSTDLVYGFQWVARFPLLAVAWGAGDVDTCEQQAVAMLLPSQQRLPAAVESALDARDFARAVDVGAPLGYA